MQGRGVEEGGKDGKPGITVKRQGDQPPQLALKVPHPHSPGQIRKVTLIKDILKMKRKMSLQGEEIGKIRYTLHKKKKRRVEKERNDRKSPKIINNLRKKEK